MKISKQVAFQGIKQLLGIPYLYISHGFKLPKGSDCSKVKYQLPFEGEWTIVAGGYEKAFSHSWGIPTQRYAYDFLIMDGHIRATARSRHPMPAMAGRFLPLRMASLFPLEMSVRTKDHLWAEQWTQWQRIFAETIF